MRTNGLVEEELLMLLISDADFEDCLEIVQQLFSSNFITIDSFKSPRTLKMPLQRRSGDMLATLIT